MSDSNRDLIETYVSVRDSPEQVIAIIDGWKVDEENYYRIRGLKGLSGTERAARFIYLNHTSFNGIYRVNRSGEYNVPYGRKDGFTFDFEKILCASNALQGVELRCADFEQSLTCVSEGDLVFLDPPYTVAHNNNGFIEYNKKLFSIDDQIRLRRTIDALCSNGALFILTNAAHPSIEEIFQGCGRMLRLSRSNTLGGRNAKRGMAEEYVFTNIPFGGANGLV